MNRVPTVMRLHLVTWRAFLGVPWLIWAAAFVINLIIFGLLDPAPGEGDTGGLVSGYFGVLATFWIAATVYFSYSLSLGLSRRSYFVGTALLALASSVINGVAIYLLSLLETATNGWGINLGFFNIGFIVVDNPLGQIAIYTGAMLGFAAAGLLLGALYQRWRMVAMYALGLLVTGALGAAVAAISIDGNWPAVGSWFADQSPLALVGLVPLGMAVLATGGSYLVLRRAAP